MALQFRSITYLSDRSGTGVWRVIWPLNSINCVSLGLGIQADYSLTPVLDQQFYDGVNQIRVQRWITSGQRDLFVKWFKPLMDNKQSWLVYEEDDLMFDGTLLNEDKREYLEKKYGNLKDMSIPLYNRGRKAFEGKEVQQNIKDMLNAADFVTVTTDYIKEVYHDLYDVPMENIISLPNLLPRYMFGDRYDLDKKIDQFKKNKAKPRIGIISSLSHYNIDNTCQTKDRLAVRKVAKDGKEVWISEDGKEVQESDVLKITDDFDDIASMIRNTVNDFQYVCFGYCPPQIKDLIDSKKIEFHGGTAIMQYPSVLENLKLQAVIAPIKRCAFNYSKSFIKTMECAALGVPLFATNCLPYSRVMDSDQLFDSEDELKSKLMKLKFSSVGSYSGMIERLWKWLNSPAKEGDFNLKNFWLEDNLGIHIDLIKMRPKTLNVSIKNFETQFLKRKEDEAKNTIYKNENILITK